MFRPVTLTSLAVIVALACLHFLIFRPRRAAPTQQTALVRRLSLWERLVHAGLLLSVIGLVVTGWPGPLGLGFPLEDWMLMVHCTAGSVFALSLMAGALTWADASAFDKTDCDWVRKGGGSMLGRESLPAGRFDFAQKLLFWCTTTLGLAVLVTATLPLLKFFDTDQQVSLLRWHKISGLLLVLASLVHGYFALVARPGGWRLLISGKVSTEWAKAYHSLWWHDVQEKERKQS
ncbi:MAG: cytochrome b/b6 domain-containing protein [Planctomycetota bacterium]|nr:cytochrome b/b6 domain-containing protein [Planctomycetota bacterium]